LNSDLAVIGGVVGIAVDLRNDHANVINYNQARESAVRRHDWPGDGIFIVNVSLTNDLKKFVRSKVQSGAFPSEEAVIEAALRRLQHEEGSVLENFIDHEFVEYCERESDDGVSLDDVLRATSTIPGSMAQTIIEEERAERF
jgi:putative addiction module CopG family antidote